MAVELSALDRVVMELEGVFDEPARMSLLRAIAALAPDAELTLNFHRVEPIQDVILVETLELALQRCERLTVIGLTQHHQRLMRYLKIPLEPPGQGPTVSTTAFGDR